MRFTLPLAAALLSAGCGSGGGSSRPVTSGSGGSGPALHDPGGGVGPVGTATTAVVATATLDAFTSLKEDVSVSDLVIPDVAGLRDRAFVVEDDGTLRVLDLSGPTPALDRAFLLPGAPLPAGAATGALSVQDGQTALLTTSGANAEGVYLFAPSTAAVASDVAAYDLNALTVTWPAGTPNSQGVDVGGQARPLTFTSGAVLTGSRLLVSHSNFDAAFDLDPGTVTAFDRDPATGALTSPQVLQTSAFNPTALTRVPTPQGDLVLVTCTGPFGSGPGAVDVVDPVTLRRVGRIDLGARNPTGRVVVSPDGARGYLASQSAAEVYVLDLAGLEAVVGGTSSRDLSARFRGGYALPSRAATNFVSSLAVSHTGRYLYAVSFNESALYVVDLTDAGHGLAADVRGFSRSGVPANFEGLANLVAVRPGEPGRDFTGPSLLVATINLAPADRTLTDVSVAIDAVAVSAH